MKAEEMTKEELLAAREIHEKTGATLKVAKIDKFLDMGPRVSPSIPPRDLPRRPNDMQGAKIGDISSDLVDEIVKDAPDEHMTPIQAAYELKSNTTMSWKEIGDRVGLKAQGLYAKVKKYARENELPYE
jgi:hypothetical protein